MSASFESPRAIAAKKVLECNKNGEALIPVHSHPLLRHISRTTVWRWISKGRLPAMIIGRVTYTTDSLANQALLIGQDKQRKTSTASRVEEAMRRIRSLGK
jgi:hypothetical protein